MTKLKWNKYFATHQPKTEYFNRAYFKGEKFLCKI